MTGSLARDMLIEAAARLQALASTVLASQTGHEVTAVGGPPPADLQGRAFRLPLHLSQIWQRCTPSYVRLDCSGLKAIRFVSHKPWPSNRPSVSNSVASASLRLSFQTNLWCKSKRALNASLALPRGLLAGEQMKTAT